MPYPRLFDDGQTVELDVHGATVDDALRLVRRTVSEACRRGRASVRIIHGHSSSDPEARNRTIKHALYDELDRRAFGEMVTSVVHFEGSMLFALPVRTSLDPRRISLRDVVTG
ncbi:MAG: Smr/MutS family protein [Rhodothermales bacterium]